MVSNNENFAIKIKFYKLHNETKSFLQHNIMKNIICSLLLIFMTAATGYAGEMVLKGTFQGENLYVRNPFASSGVGFCIYEVTVNGMTTTDEINSSAFEIDLSVYNFTMGEHVTINILYKEECTPKVLNPEVLNARVAAKIDAVAIKDDLISFTSSGESGSLPFIVEQFRWNKWIKVAEVDGKGNSTNQYSTKVRLHSGINKFRVRQTDYRNKALLSKEAVAITSIPEVTFSPEKVDDLISFSAPTMYEIYDQFGGIVFKGFGESVKVGGLEKGKYYLNYDNKLGRFTKK